MIPLSDPEVPRHRFPFVNIGFIVANISVFIYTLTLLGESQDAFFFQYGVIPAEFTSGNDLREIRLGRTLLEIASPVPTWATLFTSMFIHGGFAHILGNMVFLWVFGDNVEGRMGHVGYLLFYLACGVAASATHILFNLSSIIPTVGASGAIAGVLGAYFLFYPFHRIKTLVIFIFITVIELPALYLLGFWVLLQVFSGVGSIGVTAQTGGGVAYWAHVGGFVAGMGLVAVYRLMRGQRVWQAERRPSRGYWRFR